MQTLNREALETIRCINTRDSTDDVLDHFTGFVEQFGVTGVLIGHITSAEQVISGQPLRISTWPTELLGARVDHRAATHDPIIGYALRTNRPFYWEQALKFATRFGRTISEEHRDYGLKEGVMFPMIDIEKTPGGVSLGGEKLDMTLRKLARTSGKAIATLMLAPQRDSIWIA